MPFYLNTPPPPKPPGLLARVLGFLATAAVLVLALTFGFALFLVLLSAAVVGGIFFGWRTRRIRRQIRQAILQAEAEMAAGSERSSVSGAASSTAKTSREREADVLEGEFKVVD